MLQLAASLQTHDSAYAGVVPCLPTATTALVAGTVDSRYNGSLDGPAASVVERYPPRKLSILIRPARAQRSGIERGALVATSRPVSQQEAVTSQN
jgi:hypothetical protein